MTIAALQIDDNIKFIFLYISISGRVNSAITETYGQGFHSALDQVKDYKKLVVPPFQLGIQH